MTSTTLPSAAAGLNQDWSSAEIKVVANDGKKFIGLLVAGKIVALMEPERLSAVMRNL